MECGGVGQEAVLLVPEDAVEGSRDRPMQPIRGAEHGVDGGRAQLKSIAHPPNGWVIGDQVGGSVPIGEGRARGLGTPAPKVAARVGARVT